VPPPCEAHALTTPTIQLFRTRATSLAKALYDAPVTARRSPRQLDLLDRLVELTAAEGFSHLTLDEVAVRLRCSKATLYALASSKQELVVEVAKRFFQVSTDVVEARVASAADPLARVVAYLDAVSARLALLSRDFLDDVASFGPTAEVYRANTAAAAERIRSLIADGIEAGSFRAVHAPFTAEMVAAAMFGIQRGEIASRLGLTDAEAYGELSALVVQLLQP
jgi:AcrR family transcriptional regulator